MKIFSRLSEQLNKLPVLPVPTLFVGGSFGAVAAYPFGHAGQVHRWSWMRCCHLCWTGRLRESCKMADQEQIKILKRGATAWNCWRKENPDVMIDLDEADLAKLNLSGVDLSKAFLQKADFYETDLAGADLSEAHLMDAKLLFANLSDANLSQAMLFGTDFMGSDLSNANLTGATLAKATLVSTKVDNAKISGSWIYAVNVWDLEGEFAEQKDLIITRKGQPIITVDNIKVAQFIFLILNNEEIRDVINTLTSKSVLILGRFADDKRKAILNSLRNSLREYNLLPIVFDFDRPIDRNITETVKTLAGISYFVIADVTSPKSSPLELQAIIPDYQIPVVPIIQGGELSFSMINDLRTQHSGLLDPLTYDTEESLIKVLKPAIIDPAIEKQNELRLIKAQKPKIRSAKDFLEKEME